VESSVYKGHISAEPVEKVQTANFNNFGTVKNQQLTSRRIKQKRQILGFSTVSLFSLKNQRLKKL